MPTLVENVGNGKDATKRSSLQTIGYVCETDDQELRDALAQHSNAILTAVVQGARKEEPNNEIRVAAITALGDSLEFVRTNFENEGERNYIMQVVCFESAARIPLLETEIDGLAGLPAPFSVESFMKTVKEPLPFGLILVPSSSPQERSLKPSHLVHRDHGCSRFLNRAVFLVSGEKILEQILL
jgi:importin subunit beta-1